MVSKLNTRTSNDYNCLHSIFMLKLSLAYEIQCKSTRKTCFFNEFNTFPRNFAPTMLYALLFIGAAGLMGLSIEALKKQEWTEVFWLDKVYNAKVNLEHG